MTAPSQQVLVLGASGYVGGRLVPALLDAGYEVRCLARSPAKLAGNPWAERVEVVQGDLLSGNGVAEAFAGADRVVHLVHSMGKAASFAQADRRIATIVAAAAEGAGVGRIVYLGGLGEVDARTSPHLRSRAEVGSILLAASVPATVLRAAIIIGSGSASFEMLRHLVEKLPIMVTPRWVRTRIQPIAIRDVVRYLVGVLAEESTVDHVFDIAGPDVLTYEQMMQVYAEVAGLPRRLILQVPVLTPNLSSYWVNVVTPVPFGVAKPLVGSLTTEVVKRSGGEDIAPLVPGDCLPYRESLELALQRVRDLEVESSWRDAELGGRDPAEPYPGDPAWSGGTLLSDVRTARTAGSPQALFDTVTSVGGERGWPTFRFLWEVRGVLDRLIGGIGLRRGRRHPVALRVGDALDFWRVEDIRAPEGDGMALLRLRAEMIVPGDAWLEFRIEPEPDGGALLTQRALFAPRGLLGRLYWIAMSPFHPLIFATMARALAAQAAATSSGAPTAPREDRGDPAAAPRRQPRRTRRAG